MKREGHEHVRVSVYMCVSAHVRKCVCACECIYVCVCTRKEMCVCVCVQEMTVISNWNHCDYNFVYLDKAEIRKK